MTEARPRANGFTLVEVLVALVVSAFLLAVVMDGAIGARQRESLALEKAEAVALARDLLARAAVAPFSEGQRTGIEQRSQLGWEVRESVWQADPRRRFVLAEIAVRIRGRQDGVLVDISTRRLKPLVKS